MSDLNDRPRAPSPHEPEYLALIRPELSTRIVRSIAVYFEEQYGAAALESLLQDTGLPREYLKDDANYVSLAYLERLLKCAVTRSGDPRFAFNAGAYTIDPKIIGVAYSLLAEMYSVPSLYKKLVELGPHYNLVGNFKVIEQDSTSVTLLYEPKAPEFNDSELVSDLRAGQYASVPRLVGLPEASTKTEVIERNGIRSYHYVFTWNAYNPSMKLPAMLFVVGMVAVLFPALFLPELRHWVVLIEALVVGALTAALSHFIRSYRIVNLSSREKEDGWRKANLDVQGNLEKLHNANQQLFRRVAELETANQVNRDLNSQLQANLEALGLEKAERERLYEEVQIKNKKLEKHNTYLETELKLKEENANMKRQLQEQKELERVKLRFFSNINHELRNPLTFLIPSIEHLMNEPGDMPLRDYRSWIRDMKANALRMLKLVNDLLDLSKIDEGRVFIPYESRDINVLVRRTTSMVEAGASGQKLKLVMKLGDALPPCTINEEKIEGALLNLLSNAFKFTPSGGTITVSTGYEGGQVWIKVEDTGPGIPSDRLSQLFERFSTVGTQVSRGYGSAGLGLSIVKAYIETLHHGTVKVESKEGQGTAFIISLMEGDGAKNEQYANRRKSLPAPQQTEHMAFERRRDTTTGVRPLGELLSNASSINVAALKEFTILEENSGVPVVPGNPTILIVDDEPMMLKLLKGLLYKDYNILTAENRFDGEALALTHLPDIIMTDREMGGAKSAGFDLCRALKSNPRTREIPIIMVTANERSFTDGLDSQLNELAPNDYLYKPFNSEQLKSRIRVHVEKELSKKKLEHAYAELKVVANQLELMSRTDGLTGVANRRFLEETAKAAFSVAQEQSRALACIMLDIDHFKKFNSDFGHAGGDQVLRSVAQCLQHWFKDLGHVARYGGEEFTVLLPDYDQEAALAQAQAFRAEIEGTAFGEQGQFHITVSLGVASFPEQPCSSHEELFHIADDALYLAKKTRNTAVAAAIKSHSESVLTLEKSVG